MRPGRERGPNGSGAGTPQRRPLCIPNPQEGQNLGPWAALCLPRSKRTFGSDRTPHAPCDPDSPSRNTRIDDGREADRPGSPQNPLPDPNEYAQTHSRNGLAPIQTAPSRQPSAGPERGGAGAPRRRPLCVPNPVESRREPVRSTASISRRAQGDRTRNSRASRAPRPARARGPQSSPRPRMETYPEQPSRACPRTTWSSSGIPTSSPTSTRRRVTSTSSGLGSGSPLG